MSCGHSQSTNSLDRGSLSCETAYLAEGMDMTGNSSVLIGVHIDLLFEALNSYVAKLVRDAQIVHANSVEALLPHEERAARFALVVLDCDLPGFGWRVSRTELLRKFGQAPLVLLASEIRGEEVDRAYQCGVNAYLPKTAPGPIILAGLALAYSGQSYFPRNGYGEAVNDPEKSDGAKKKRLADGLSKSITRRQREVLELLAIGRSNAEIAENLSLAESTVRLHLREAYRRLGVRNRVQAAQKIQRLFPPNAHFT